MKTSGRIAVAVMEHQRDNRVNEAVVKKAVGYIDRFYCFGTCCQTELTCFYFLNFFLLTSVAFKITTFSKGLSQSCARLVATLAILSITSKPFTTSPNTV